MYLYQVGKPYNPDKLVWPEAYQYSFRRNYHSLEIFLRQPAKEEIIAIRDGDGRFTFSTFGPEYLLISWEFKDENNEPVISGDCSFSIWLVAEDEREKPRFNFPIGVGAMLTVFLVDAETGILLAMRQLGLGRKFTLSLHKAIEKQFDYPLPQDYDDKLRNILARYTTKDLLNNRRQASYKIGTTSEIPTFELGMIVATASITEFIGDKDISDLVMIHSLTDDYNSDERVLTEHNIKDKKIWIITEADRSLTTVLFPYEY